MKRKWIILTILLAPAILFALLKDTFGASIYISLSFVIAFCGYFIFETILEYLKDFHFGIEESFDLYIAQLINSSNLTSEDVEKGRDAIFKKFKKSLLKDKLIEIFKIVFAFLILVVSIVLLFRQ